MKVVCEDKMIMELEMAETFLKRFLGLMGRKCLKDNSALLLKPCSSIHTCFMKFPIDVIYLNKNYQVLYKETVKPWKTGKIVKGAKMVLEMAAGQGGCLHTGDRLRIVE